MIGLMAPTHRHKGARRLRVQRIGLVAAVVVVVITGLRVPTDYTWRIGLGGGLMGPTSTRNWVSRGGEAF